MKFLWFQFMEFKHNKAVTLLIIVQFIFSMTCWQFAYSVTKDYLYLSHKLNNEYEYSLRLASSSIDPENISAAENLGTNVRGFGVNYYHCVMEEGGMLDIGSYTKETFTDFDFAYSGEKLDTEKDYENALPAYVSCELADKYHQGEYVTCDIGKFYICGHLNDNSLFYMSRNETSNLFIAVYDKNGVLSNNKASKAAVFFTSDSEAIYDLDLAKTIKNVTNTVRPDWKEELSGAFNEISGLLIISVWVIAISLIGLFANNMLTFENHRQTHAVQLLIGAKRHSVIGLYIWRMLGSVIVAIPATAAIFRLIAEKYDKLVFSYGAVIFSLVISAAISMISVFFIWIKFSGRGVFEEIRAKVIQLKSRILLC